MLRRLLASAGLVVLTLAISIAAIACESNRPTSPFPSSSTMPAAESSVAFGSVEPKRTLTDSELSESIRFRTDFGLRADESWIRAVASNPGTDWTTYAVPVTPSELVELNQRALAADAITPIAVAYGASHAGEWAGAYIDNENAGVLVILFSGHVEEHRQAILRAIKPGSLVEFRAVRRSLRELESMANQLRGTDSWFRSLPAFLSGYGVDVQGNTVLVEYSAIDPSIDAKILAHFQWPADAVTLKSDGTGALLIQSGSLDVRVEDRIGHAVSGVECIAISDLTGRGASQMPPAITNKRGHCLLRNLRATGFWIRIQTKSPGGGQQVLGYGRAVVAADQTSEVTIEITK